MTLEPVWTRIERRLCTPDDPLTPSVDMVIGLGTDVSRDGTDVSPQSKSIVRKSAQVLEQTRAPWLLFCGGYHVPGLHEHTEARTMASYFQRTVVIPHHQYTLLIEEKSWRTYQQADRILPILKKNNCRNVVIVSQQLHARRVRATFRKRWTGTGIRFAVVKAHAPYGPFGSQRRFDHFLRFVAWDAAGLVISKIKGYC